MSPQDLYPVQDRVAILFMHGCHVMSIVPKSLAVRMGGTFSARRDGFEDTVIGPTDAIVAVALVKP